MTASLRETQTRFWELLQAPHGVEARAAALREAGGIVDETLADWIEGGPRLDPVAQLEIHSNMYFVRLHDCLVEDFPKLRDWLGADVFRNLIVDYVLAHPPSHFSLRELGRALPDFVSSHAVHGEDRLAAGIAALEWARVDVFDDRDSTPLTREDLVVEAAADPEAFRVALLPATRLIRVAAPVLPLWRRLETGISTDPAAESVGDRAEACSVLVWRSETGIRHRSLDADEARALAVLRSTPATVVRLAESVLEGADPAASNEAASRRFAEILDRWTHDGVLVAA